MIDFSRPETWTAAALLFGAVLAFWRGDIIPNKTHEKVCGSMKDGHDKVVEGLRASHDEIVKELKDVINRQDQAISLWREMALRGTDLAEKSIGVAQGRN